MAPQSSKSILITGSGIGEALAKEAHAKGYQVFATARKVEALSHLAELGMKTLPLDVTSDESVERLKSELSELHVGRLNLLVNNAGQVIPKCPASDMDISAAQQLFDANVFGVMRMVKAFTPLLAADGDGRIVNVGSMAGTIPFPLEAAYAASKAAVHSYSDAIRVELAPLGIQVINLCSGGVATAAAKEKSSLTLLETSLFVPFEDAMAAAVNKVDHGTGSWTIWFATTFFSRTFMDKWMAKRAGLPSVPPPRQAESEDKKDL
ncbi:hypothetical protein HDZ31DRAFT_60476 [Schizophyllum fasciatum]